VVVTGLKKAFTLTEFMDIVEDCGLALAAFIDEQEINCYIAALTA
jgi:hypothetical protein